MFEILEGGAPWLVRDEAELKDAIKGDFKFRNLCHPQLQSIISGCLTNDKETRLTAEDVLGRLEDFMGIRSKISW